jgi:hypothetical protein
MLDDSSVAGQRGRESDARTVEVLLPDTAGEATCTSCT